MKTATLFMFASFITIIYGDGNKRWIHNTNFGNKENWRRGEVPCKSDRVIFPKKAPVISVLKSLYITDAHLPLDGELVINDGASLFAVPPEQMHTASCHGKDAKYTRSKPLSWFDPANWCSMKQQGKCVQTGVHASMVPSQYDKVTFPHPKDSYFVDVDYDDSVVIQGLNYRLKWQTTHGFRTFVSSTEGRKQFVNTQGQLVPTIAMTRKGCTDNSGCVPNTLQKRLFNKICSKVKCPKPSCDHPFKIKGHCCDWCGSQVVLLTGDGFSFNSLESLIRSKLAKNEKVQTDVLKISPKQVQIALTDNEGGKHATKSVVDVAKMLEDKKENFGIVSFEVKSSSGSMKLYDYQIGGKKNVPIILGVLFGLLFFAIVVVFAYEVNRRVRNGQLTLPQIQNMFIQTSPSNLTRMSWARSRSSSDPPRANIEMRTTMTSFDNPVYRASGDINVTPIDDMYDEPMASIIGEGLTNPAYEPGLSSAKSKDKPHQESAPEPGSIVIKRKEKIEIINKAYEADSDNGEASK